MVRNRESTTLLQTAQAILTDVDKVSKRTVRVLFDIGSQKSFVTEDVCKSLNLRVSRKEKLILSGFGSKNETAQLLSVVRVKIMNVSEMFCTDVELFVVPRICSPICDQNIELAQSTYSHLMNLKLADSSENGTGLEIDVMIGGDLHREFDAERKILVYSSPIA